jgi:T5SS/PEP-CTERM-associated repeat protein
VTNGGKVFDTAGTIGSSSSGNAVFVTGTNSAWSNSSDLAVGSIGSFNQLDHAYPVG